MKNGIGKWRGLAGPALRAAFLLCVAGTGGAVAEAPATPYEIDVILSETGSISFLGRAEEEVLKIEESVLNQAGGVHGRPVRFVFHDDQSNPQVALQAMRQAMARQPKVVLGSDLVSTCNAMAPLTRNGPVLYCLSPGIHPEKGSYVFSSSVSTLDLFRATLTYYRLRGWTRIAILTSTDASGQDAERGLQEELARPENKALQLVAAERFNPSDVSADAQIQRMKSANPQAIVTWTSGTPLGTVFRAITDASWDVPVGISESNMLYTQMKQYAGITPKQLYIATADWLPSTHADLPQAVRDQKARMFAAFEKAGLLPDEAAGLAWDLALISVAALDAVPEDAPPAQVRDHIAGLQGFAGTTGLYDFPAIPQRGIGVEGVVMTLWDPKANNWTVVSHPTGTPF